MSIGFDHQTNCSQNGSKLVFDEMNTIAKRNLHPYKRGVKAKNFLKYTNKWVDYVCNYAGRKVKQRRSSKTRYRKVIDAESMIAALRNKYRTDHVALMIFVNGYYEHDQSFTFNSYVNGPNVEYSIMTQKNTTDIAHEFLHLFGAVDLYPHTVHNFNFKDLAKKYPNEIMRVTHKAISKLNVSPITQYYLGWRDSLSNHDLRLLYHLSNVTEYQYTPVSIQSQLNRDYST